MYKSVQKLTYPAQRCVSFGTKSTITSQAYIIRTVHVVHSLSDSKQEALDSLYIFPLVLALRYVYRRITEILQRNCNKQRITMLLEMTCTIQNGVFKKVL